MTIVDSPPKKKSLILKDADVVAYLMAHPDFLLKHPELMEALTPPSRDLGEDVLDFQHFQLKNLQKDKGELQSKYEGLVGFCRDNLSVQKQVHEAVIRLMRVRNLRQLLEVVTLDLAALFNMDVVRLVMESVVAEDLAPAYAEDAYSGVAFIDPGTVDDVFGANGAVVLVSDAQRDVFPAFDTIFADCAELIRSCALVRLPEDELEQPVLLAFGTRSPEQFDPTQGIELLLFLGSVLALQLEKYLPEGE